MFIQTAQRNQISETDGKWDSMLNMRWHFSLHWRFVAHDCLYIGGLGLNLHGPLGWRYFSYLWAIERSPRVGKECKFLQFCRSPGRPSETVPWTRGLTKSKGAGHAEAWEAEDTDRTEEQRPEGWGDSWPGAIREHRSWSCGEGEWALQEVVTILALTLSKLGNLWRVISKGVTYYDIFRRPHWLWSWE